jgi:hydroxylamine reductase
MSMFCFQCQEAAKGTGCTIKGVCGKTPEVAGIQDVMIYFLRGMSVYANIGRANGMERPGSRQVRI